MNALIAKLRTLLLLALFLLRAERHCVQAKSNFEMIYTDINCSNLDTEARLAELKCYMSKNVKRRSFSMEFKFNQDVPMYFNNILIVLPRKYNDFVLLNLTNLNGCQVLSNRNQVPFMQMSRAMFDRFSNLPNQCPLRKNVLYYIRGFRLDLNSIPAFAFESYMKCWFDFLLDGKKLLTGYVESRIHLRRGRGGS